VRQKPISHSQNLIILLPTLPTKPERYKELAFFGLELSFYGELPLSTTL
jgi:hypothetical protein